MKNPFSRPDLGMGSFLPQEYVERRAELRANLLCLALFGVVMFGVVGAFFVTNRQWLTVKRARDGIAAQYAQEASRIEQLKLLEKQQSQIMEKAEVSTALLERIPRSLLMSELANRKPDEITLLEVVMTGKRIQNAPPAAAPAPATQVKNLGNKPGAVAMMATPATPRAAERVMPPRFEHTLKLVGVASTNNNVADYIAALKACPLLANVDLKSIKETTIEKVELRKFELEAVIRRDADTRALESAGLDSGKPVEGMPGDDPARLRPGNKSRPSITVVQPKEQE